ncbi:hypothetical protein PZA11_007967 [Diplocarpon coronariae]
MPTLQVGPDSDPELQEVADIMGRSRKVIVVTGAGISTNCGIPDFRSENGLYSLIQAQYDQAIKNPPWEQTNLFDIDDRPKKKRKQWYYEVVAPDGKVVDVIDEDAASIKDSRPAISKPQLQTPTRSLRSRSSITSISTSRVTTPPPKSSSGSSLSSCSSLIPEVPASFTQNVTKTQLSTSFNVDRPSRGAAPLNTSLDAANRFSTPESLSPDCLQSQEPSHSRPALSQTRSLPNLKGRDLFDAMVWQDAFTTSIFYMFVSSLRNKVQSVAQTSESHKFLRVLRDGGRLVRNYSQNVDMLEEREGLCTDLLQGPGVRGRFNNRRISGASGAGSGGCESVSLHGTLRRLRCALCNTGSDWDAEDRLTTTAAGGAPDCPACSSYSAKRAGNGRRTLAVGRLRPDIVLYGEEHPHANLIGPLVTHDMALGPDVLLIMGTSLRVHGLKVMVKEFAKATHARGGKVVFVNRTKASESTWGDVIDYWVAWDCDQWVLDLKDRREDIWLPQGAAEEKRPSKYDSSKVLTSNAPNKRPTSKRDDKRNGVYLTYKILDQLRGIKDNQGLMAKRSVYWAAPVRSSSIRTPAKKSLPKKPTVKAPKVKVPQFRAPRAKAQQVQGPQFKRRTTKQSTRKSHLKPCKKRKTAEPEYLLENAKNHAEHITTAWERLRTIAPGLCPDISPELRQPLRAFSGNRSSFITPFVFKSSSNNFPNISNDVWPLDKMNLISHPPNGADIPILTPKAQENKAPERKALHAYGTRASRRDEPKRADDASDYEEPPAAAAEAARPALVITPTTRAPAATKPGVTTPLSQADTIVVEIGSDPVDENTIVVDSPCKDRIKRHCSIGAIVSSPEDGVMWHDAREDLGL